MSDKNYLDSLIPKEKKPNKENGTPGTPTSGLFDAATSIQFVPATQAAGIPAAPKTEEQPIGRPLVTPVEQARMRLAAAGQPIPDNTMRLRAAHPAPELTLDNYGQAWRRNPTGETRESPVAEGFRAAVHVLPQAIYRGIQQFADIAAAHPDAWRRMSYNLPGVQQADIQNKEKKQESIQLTVRNEQALSNWAQGQVQRNIAEAEVNGLNKDQASFLYKLGASIPTIGGAIAITALTKNPALTTGLFTAYNDAMSYGAYKNAGVGTDEAAEAAALKSIGMGLVSAIPLAKYFNTVGSFAQTFASRVGGQALSAAARRTLSNAVDATVLNKWDKVQPSNNLKTLFAGVFQDALLAAAVSAPAAAYRSYLEQQDYVYQGARAIKAAAAKQGIKMTDAQILAMARDAFVTYPAEFYERISTPEGSKWMADLMDKYYDRTGERISTEDLKNLWSQFQAINKYWFGGKIVGAAEQQQPGETATAAGAPGYYITAPTGQAETAGAEPGQGAIIPTTQENAPSGAGAIPMPPIYMGGEQPSGQIPTEPQAAESRGQYTPANDALVRMPPTAKPITLIHYSPTPGLQWIDPSQMGTGRGGEELKTQMYKGKMLGSNLPKSDFYGLNSQVEPQFMGDYVYKAIVDENDLYHAKPGEQTNDQELRAQGYTGIIYSSSDDPWTDGQVRMFTQVPVTMVGKSHVPEGYYPGQYAAREALSDRSLEGVDTSLLTKEQAQSFVQNADQDIVSAYVTPQDNATPEERAQIEADNKKRARDIRYRLNMTPAIGHYGNQEETFIFPPGQGQTRARMLNQQSWIRVRNGVAEMIDTATGKPTMRTDPTDPDGGIEFNDNLPDFYTEVKTKNGPLRYSWHFYDLDANGNLIKDKPNSEADFAAKQAEANAFLAGQQAPGTAQDVHATWNAYPGGAVIRKGDPEYKELAKTYEESGAAAPEVFNREAMLSAQAAAIAASSDQKALDSTVNDILKSNDVFKGVTWVGVPKSAGSTYNKIERSGRPIEQFGDMVRGSLILPDFNPQIARTFFQELAKRYTLEDALSSLLDEHGMNMFGYRDVKAHVIMPDGTTAEIQLHTKETWDYKRNVGELAYRQWRGVSLYSLNEQQRQQMEQTVNMVRQGYDKLYATYPPEKLKAFEDAVLSLFPLTRAFDEGVPSMPTTLPTIDTPTVKSLDLVFAEIDAQKISAGTNRPKNPQSGTKSKKQIQEDTNRMLEELDNPEPVESVLRGVIPLAEVFNESAIRHDLLEGGWANLADGHIFAPTIEEKAMLHQLLRDPRAEHGWLMLWGPDGRLLAIQHGFLGLPFQTIIIKDATQEAIVKIAAEARRLGATSVTAAHSHASGRVNPSQNDINLYGWLGQQFSAQGLGYQALIIDHNTTNVFTFDEQTGDLMGSVMTLGEVDNDPLLQGPRQHELLGQKITGAHELMLAAQKVHHDPTQAVLFTTSSPGYVRGIWLIDEPTYTNKDAMIALLDNVVPETGSRQALLAVDRSQVTDEQMGPNGLFSNLIQNGYLLDVVATNPVEEPEPVVATSLRREIEFPSPTETEQKMMKSGQWFGIPVLEAASLAELDPETGHAVLMQAMENSIEWNAQDKPIYRYVRNETDERRADILEDAVKAGAISLLPDGKFVPTNFFPTGVDSLTVNELDNGTTYIAPDGMLYTPHPEAIESYNGIFGTKVDFISKYGAEWLKDVKSFCSGKYDKKTAQIAFTKLVKHIENGNGYMVLFGGNALGTAENNPLFQEAQQKAGEVIFGEKANLTDKDKASLGRIVAGQILTPEAEQYAHSAYAIARIVSVGVGSLGETGHPVYSVKINMDKVLTLPSDNKVMQGLLAAYNKRGATETTSPLTQAQIQNRFEFFLDRKVDVSITGSPGIRNAIKALEANPDILPKNQALSEMLSHVVKDTSDEDAIEMKPGIVYRFVNGQAVPVGSDTMPVVDFNNMDAWKMSLDDFLGFKPSPESTKEAWALYQAGKIFWQSRVRAALTSGQLPIDVAFRNEATADYVEHIADTYLRAYTLERMPRQRYYHATTSLSKVLVDGRLKSRYELTGGNYGDTPVGLGGSHMDSVSVTSSIKAARDIAIGLLDAHRIATGEMTVFDMVERAKKGSDALVPYYRDFAYMAGLTDETDLEDLSLDVVFDNLLDAWASAREAAGGPINPYLVGQYRENWARLDPNEIGIVEVDLPDGTYGARTTELGEWQILDSSITHVGAAHGLDEVIMGPDYTPRVDGKPIPKETYNKIVKRIAASSWVKEHQPGEDFMKGFESGLAEQTRAPSVALPQYLERHRNEKTWENEPLDETDIIGAVLSATGLTRKKMAYEYQLTDDLLNKLAGPENRDFVGILEDLIAITSTGERPKRNLESALHAFQVLFIEGDKLTVENGGGFYASKSPNVRNKLNEYKTTRTFTGDKIGAMANAQHGVDTAAAIDRWFNRAFLEKDTSTPAEKAVIWSLVSKAGWYAGMTSREASAQLWATLRPTEVNNSYHEIIEDDPYLKRRIKTLAIDWEVLREAGMTNGIVSERARIAEERRRASATNIPEVKGNDPTALSGISSMTPYEVLDFIRSTIQQIAFDNNAPHLEVLDARLVGSRTRGTPQKGDDLDVIVRYSSMLTPDEMTSFLKENAIEIDGVQVHVIPTKTPLVDYLREDPNFHPLANVKPKWFALPLSAEYGLVGKGVPKSFEPWGTGRAYEQPTGYQTEKPVSHTDLEWTTGDPEVEDERAPYAAGEADIASSSIGETSHQARATIRGASLNVAENARIQKLEERLANILKKAEDVQVSQQKFLDIVNAANLSVADVNVVLSAYKKAANADKVWDACNRIYKSAALQAARELQAKEHIKELNATQKAQAKEIGQMKAAIAAKYIIQENRERVRAEFNDYMRAAGVPASLFRTPQQIENLVDSVRGAKSLEAAELNVAAKIDAAHRKDLIDTLRDLQDRIKKSSTIAVDAKERALELINGINFSGHPDKFYEQIKRMADEVEKKRQAGEDVELSSEHLKQLKMLSQKPVSHMTTAQLEQLVTTVQNVAGMGRLKQKLRESAYQREVDELIAELQPNVIAQDIAARKMVSPDVFIETGDTGDNRWLNVRDAAHRIALGAKPAVHLMDALGVPQLKERIDERFTDYLTMRDSLRGQLRNIAKTYKLNAASMRRIGVVMTAEDANGAGVLREWGITKEKAQEISRSLTVGEQAYHIAARKILDQLHPQVDGTLQQNFNLKLGYVPGYFPRYRPLNDIDNLEVHNRFGQLYDPKTGKPVTTIDTAGLKKNVSMSLTHQRTAKKNRAELNAGRVMERYIDDAVYQIQMTHEIRVAKDAIDSPEIASALGGLGHEILDEYYAMLARKGGTVAGRVVPVLDFIRQNTGAYQIVFKVSSALVQWTQYADVVKMVGPRYAFLGLADLTSSSQWRKFVLRESPKIRDMVGDDPAFLDMGNNWWTKAGSFMVQHFDHSTRIASFLGAYRAWCDANGVNYSPDEPHAAGIQFASELTGKILATPYPTDMPVTLSTGYGIGNKSVARMILQFQNPMLFHAANVGEQVFGGWKKGKHLDALWGAFVMVILGAILEAGVRRGSKRLMGGTNTESIVKDSIDQMVGSIPYVGSIYSAVQYGNNPVPSIAMMMDTFKYSNQLMNAVKADNPNAASIAKASILLACTGAGYLGVFPGGSQISQVLRYNFLDEAAQERWKELLFTQVNQEPVHPKLPGED